MVSLYQGLDYEGRHCLIHNLEKIFEIRKYLGFGKIGEKFGELKCAFCDVNKMNENIFLWHLKEEVTPFELEFLGNISA